ncbi:MAG TPA: ATP-binding protein [Leptolyngbyaceae cyanobacterium M33_DOE_097]|uniref:ATP-binding protein n=1 Tax=Oscillatoriales cyanobacterium SpSt-418 TaxID=2282169 RepID=A0A7C3PJD2_9CYAN|nr:ATP-binding protein [Leptolyngbyaceae cyanobacterium M33_DOE_097]
MDRFPANAHNTQPARYEFVLTNRVDDLTRLSEWINDLANQLQISAKGVFRVELILEEAVTNIINYAYVDNEEHTIRVTLLYLDQTLTVELRDDGIPFDPLQRPEVQLPKTLEEATEGGLGIHLIRSYVDECHYQREADSNVLTLKILNWQ